MCYYLNVQFQGQRVKSLHLRTATCSMLFLQFDAVLSELTNIVE